MDQVGGTHYKDARVQPWDLQRSMRTSGNPFVDARRADVIKYVWRQKGDGKKMLEDLRKAQHCLEAAITDLELDLKS